MEIIDTNTVMVDNFSDLSSVLTANSEYTYVYLGTDIVMTSGIQINNSRTLLVIDGEYPRGSGVFHSITDTGTDFGMIYKSNVSGLDITFKNMTINGRNFYGMPRIADGNVSVNVTYQNVTYTGPQMTWHWAGLTRYVDCAITIVNTGNSAMNEVAEVCRLEIGGKTTIRHTSPATFSVFYFYKTNASLTILADADVQITANYDFLYHEFPPALTIQPGASFKLTTQRGVSRSAAFRFASILVDEGASFQYYQLSNSVDLAALYVDGAFTVNKGARVYMQADFTSSASTRRLLQFTANSPARALNLNSPKSFVIYTRGPGTVAYFSTATPFQFTAGQVNTWNTAGLFPAAGTFDDPPLYPWHNPDWSSFEIRGSAGSTATTVTSSTLAPPVSPALTNFQLQSTRVLSVGELPLTINPVADDGAPVTGTTDSYANIKVMYTDEGGTHTVTGTADENGAFSIPTPGPIPLGATVEVACNVPFLYVMAQRAAQEAGELYLKSVPAIISFVAPPISARPLCILGRALNEAVTVVDKRAHRTKWELTVSIDEPMLCPESGLVLPGKVIFVPPGSAYDDEEPIDPGVFRRVYVGGPDVETTIVKWDENMGILLHLTGALHLGDKYVAQLIWQVNPVE